MSEPAEDGAAPAGAQRLDKWLWFARVVKSRTLAAALIAGGKVRVNKVKVEKPSQCVKPGDVITSSIKKTVRVLRVVAPGERRGPASQAAKLYEELTPPTPPTPSATLATGLAVGVPGLRAPGTGRPTKRDRRILDRLRGEGG
jgi:ribosome-associated heat shock protein Hsp15